MTALPAAAYISDNARTQGEGKTFHEAVRNVIAELLGGAAEPAAQAIIGGAITPTSATGGGTVEVDTEGAAASDDLGTIVTTNTPDGRWLLLHPADAGRVVVVKHAAGGAGQIHLRGSVDFALRAVDSYLLLRRDGADWYEILRSVAPQPGVVALTGATTLNEEQAGSMITNEGAAGTVVATLPPARAGLVFPFLTKAAQILQPTAAAGDTIRVGANVSPAAGNVASAAQAGQSIILVAINATEWIALTAPQGTWTVST